MVQLKRDLFIGLISNNTRKFRSKNVAEYISNITNDSNIIEREYLPNQNIAIGANYKRLGYADTGLVVLASCLKMKCSKKQKNI